MTKKLMTLAVATAFTGSAFAADVSTFWRTGNGVGMKATVQLHLHLTVTSQLKPHKN